MDDISDSTRVLNMIILIVAGTALLIILFAVYAWVREQKKKLPLDDIDWGKEKEKLLLLASEKKASRTLNKSKDNKEKGGNGDGPGD